MADVRILKLTHDHADEPAWRQALATFKASATLKTEAHSHIPREQVQRGTLLGRDVVIKFMALRTITQRLATAARLSRPHRQWRGHKKLAALGVHTSKPLCLARMSDPDRLVLVLDYIPGKSLLQHLADKDLSVRAQHRLAEALGVQIGTIAAHRSRNRDHKLSNLIAVNPHGEHPQIAVIDAVGVGPKRKRSRQGVAARMLFSAIVEPTGLHLPVRRSVRVRAARACARCMLGEIPRSRSTAKAKAKALTRKLITLASRRLQSHGDPVPQVNPLAAGD